MPLKSQIDKQTHEVTRSRIILAINQTLNILATIESSDDFVSQLKFDETDRIEVLMALEDEFEIQLPDVLIFECNSVDDYVKYLLVNNPEVFVK